MNWNFLKFKKEEGTLIVKESQTISKIKTPNGTYKLPEPLEFSMDANTQKVIIEVLDYMCKHFLEKEVQ